MYKSRIVELVLLNSLLVLSGCGRCQREEKVDEKGNKVVTDCTGGRRGGGGVHFFPYTGGGSRAVAPTTSGGSRTGGSTGSVGRGGFGSTGGAAS